MKSFYEQDRDSENGLKILPRGNFLFPSHFHSKTEIFILTQGKCVVTCNGISYQIDGGSIVFFSSYDIHSYDYQSDDTKGFCIITPTDYTERFYKRNVNKRISYPVLADKQLTLEVYDLTKKYLFSSHNAVKRAGVELILSLIEPHLSFTDEKSDFETTLVKDLLIHLNDNFISDVSLSALSKKFGYSTAHVSRVFNKYVKKSLPDYVNELRLNKVNELVESRKINVTSAIFEAGFKSIQTYYRVKSKLTK